MPHIETNTNKLLRKKYFINADSVLLRKERVDKGQRTVLSRVIDAADVVVAPTPVFPGDIEGLQKLNVDVVREGDRITQLQITCPCGRHAELDCEYDQGAQGGAGQ